MANYELAKLTKYQAKITSQFQLGELRFRLPAVFNFFRRNTEIMIPSHNTIKNAAKRATGEIAWVNRSSRSLGTSGEVYNHTGTIGDSSILVPSWTPYDDKIKYSLKQGNDKIYELDEIIAAEMLNMNINFTEGLEAAAATFAHANRSGVNVADGVEGDFNGDNDVFEIQEDVTNILKTGFRAAQIISSTMMLNKWSGFITILCDTIGYNKMRALAAQGAQNATNASFQFDNKEFILSPELTASASALGYTKGYFIAVPEGVVSVLDWIPQQNRVGVVSSVNQYGAIIHPVTGLPLAYHTYEARSDEQGNAGDRQDVVTQTQFFTYLSFNHAPLSVTDSSPLQAFAFVESV
jgi:hypothetical protein